MHPQPYELVRSPEGMVARINVRGAAVLTTPTINRGTAFIEEERRALGLTGLCPTPGRRPRWPGGRPARAAWTSPRSSPVFVPPC